MPGLYGFDLGGDGWPVGVTELGLDGGDMRLGSLCRLNCIVPGCLTFIFGSSLGTNDSIGISFQVRQEHEEVFVSTTF